MTTNQLPRALDDLRVLDLTDAKGIYCTRLFADMGADVLRVEPPGGDFARRRPPFVDDLPGPERSLYHFVMNASKRSITLDIETEDGAALLRRIARSADIVIESFAPGYLDSLDLGYEDLARENAAIIVTSISPFGKGGPYEDWEGPDIVNMGLGGQLYLSGFPGEPPAIPWGEQSYYQGALHGAYATMIALTYRDLTGQGQAIDVSIQECVATAMETAMQFYDLQGYVRTRTGSQRRAAGFGLYPCADGFILWMAGARNFENLIEWMKSEGVDTTEFETPQWSDQHYRLEHGDDFDQKFIPWGMTHTKAELAETGQAQHLPNAPIQTVAEIVSDPHLRERQYYVDVDHPELGRTITYPGPPYRLQKTPARIRRAPLLGEHNWQIYREELGLSLQEIATLSGAGVI